IRVAVLDTGVDRNHPDFADARIDLENVYNATDEPSEDGDYVAMDYDGHGTHVAGTIAAHTNNEKYVSAVMWEGELLPVKVLPGDTFTVAEGILYAAGLGETENPQPVDIINLSLGGALLATDTTLKEAVHKVATETNIIMVAAAGTHKNNGDESSSEVLYPAKYEEVIAVGAVDSGGQKANYSNYGENLEIMAPGGGRNQGVLSLYFDEEKKNYFTEEIIGTSMATPHVTGVIGLMLAEGIKPDQTRGLLQKTAVDLGEPGFDEDHGYGLVNSYLAVNGIEKLKIGVKEPGAEIKEALVTELIDLDQKNYKLNFEIPSGEYEVFAFLDVQGNNKKDPGDYYVQSEPQKFYTGSDYSLDFLLQEEKEN
ncbi:MAG: S8 family peptidase, partial [Bacillota bacterium]